MRRATFPGTSRVLKPEEVAELVIEKLKTQENSQPVQQPVKEVKGHPPLKRSKATVFDQHGLGKKVNVISPVQQAVLQAKALLAYRRKKCRKGVCKKQSGGKVISVRSTRTKKKRNKRKKRNGSTK